MSEEHDRTNQGVLFEPHEDQRFVGQGRLDIEGAENRIVLIKEKLSRDGKPQLVLYQRIGVLFSNDKKGNEKAPDYTGPVDAMPDIRVAAWSGKTDRGRYLSLKASRRERQEEQEQVASAYPDDEIPF